MSLTVLGFVAILIGALIFGLPVAFAIAFTALVMFLLGAGDFVSPAFLVQRFFGGVDSFPLLAVPLFMATGMFMNTAGITKRIYAFASDLVGHMRLGLGQVNVVASMIFAGMSGAAVADASGLGAVEIRAMTDAGYKRDYSAAITAASSTVGPIVPPSIPIVIFGIMAEASIGSLLIAGIVPGVLIAILLMAMNEIHGRRHGYPRGNFVGLRPLWRSFKAAFLPLMTPVILIGGILSGIFTPTEAAAVALAYAMFLGLVVYREVTLREYLRMTEHTMRRTAELLIIVGAAGALAYVIIDAEVPQAILELLTAVSTNKWVILAIINVVLLVIGCFLEPVAAITIVVPVLMPLIHQLGIDPVHFGIVVVFNLVIGLLTPPVGLVLFVTSKVADLPVGKLLKAVWPFYIPLVLGLLAVTYLPGLVTFLPEMLLGR